MKLDPLNIGLIITTLVTVLAGWASQRAATKAARATAKEQIEASKLTSKEQAELEAYVRARAMDDRTITRQNAEIEDLTNDNTNLRLRMKAVEEENEKLRIGQRALINQNNHLREELRKRDE